MDSPPPEPAEEGAESRPGKVRTWWHPLLASFLRWQLGEHYQLEEEVPVGKKPLQIDVLLLRKQQGELPAQTRRMLAGLAEYFSELTLLELKGPSDTLRAGDLQTFLAYALLWRAQNQPLQPLEHMHLLVIAPQLTRPFRAEVQALGVTAAEESAGIWSLAGGAVSHRMWVLETTVLAGLEHPLLTMFSPQLLSQGPQTYTLLQQGGYTEMVVYFTQQIQQFHRLGREFAMQHLGAEDQLRQVLLEINATLSPEERLAGLSPQERLAGLAPEERLAGLAPEERLAGLAPEQILASLDPEKVDQLRQLLQAREGKDDASR